MERRVLAAIALSIAVLFLFRYYEEKRLSEAEQRKPRAQKVEPAPVPEAEPEPEAAAPAEGAAGVPPAEETEAGERTIVVEGELYRAVLDNRGGVLTSWLLKDFKSDRGQVFEMIAPGSGPQGRAYPGTLLFESKAETALAANSLYEVEIEGEGTEESLAPPATVTLRLRRGELAIEKKYRFEKETYVVGHDFSVMQGGRTLPVRFLVGQDIGPEMEHLLNPQVKLTAISNQAGKIKRDEPPEEAGSPQQVGQGDVRWAGLDILYFALIAVPERAMPYFEIEKVPVYTKGVDGKDLERNLQRVTLLADGTASYRIYVGPKLGTTLAAVKGTNLAEAIDYGWFSILVRPLLFALLWIQSFAGNYGLSIILLTLLLSVALFPFRIKQITSMKKMQVIQPKVKEIQEKYKKYKKTDPKRAEMNQEVMALYKAHNVNPLGGCLPLLLQMPFLFAFYSLLASSIELRQAPFIGWIQDLSAKDPYYVLPIVMGITMMVAQKMTPMTPGSDPTQAKIMMVMPVVLTVMFLNVSSGLNLYFLCSNIFQVAFQKVAERWIGDEQPVKKRGRK